MLHLLYEALASEIGISVSTSDPERAKHQLYAARRKAGDSALDKVSIVVPPFSTNKLWLVKTL